jgi:hypothetical protein
MGVVVGSRRFRRLAVKKATRVHYRVVGVLILASNGSYFHIRYSVAEGVSHAKVLLAQFRDSSDGHICK